MEHIAYSIGQFFEDVSKSEGIICYGVGKRFRLFEEYLGGTTAGEKVLFCVDDDRSKQGKPVSFAGRQLDVYPIEALTESRGKNRMLLITNYRFDKARKFLEERGLLEGMEYWYLSLVLGALLEDWAVRQEIPEDCRMTPEPVIPKVIHYCWFGRNPLPDRYQKWMESWRRFCPDYEIKEWNEDNYDITKNDYMREAYESKKWGFVPDYARLDIIYQYGGIYLDTDVELIKNLDDMLYQPAFMGFEDDKYVALGLGFGATARLQEIRELRDCYDSLHFRDADGGLNLMPAPRIQTEYLKRLGLRQNGEYQRVKNIVIYPEKMFSGKSPYNRRILLKSYTKSIHHYDASWLEEEERAFVTNIKL